MLWLLEKVGKKHFNLYSPSVYGMSTWGTDYQDSLEKSRKNWYFVHWVAGNEWVDDSTIKTKLNVVLETTDITKVIAYVSKCNDEELSHILQQARETFNNFVSLIEWRKPKYMELQITLEEIENDGFLSKEESKECYNWMKNVVIKMRPEDNTHDKLLYYLGLFKEMSFQST